MIKISSITSKNLSFYRTLNHFEHYGEICNVEEFEDYIVWAKVNHVKVYILGNGSNTFFPESSVKSLVLKNKLNQCIQPLTNHRLEISSSVYIAEVLTYCYASYLDSFYYLASVPATIGGALAMNAGRGKKHGLTIYDFVESVTFFEDGVIKTLTADKIKRSYRSTMFTGIQSCFILKAVFKFPPKQFTLNPIIERRKWSKENQDNIGANCGSIFKSSCYPILNLLKGLRIGNAYFSTKTCNWIVNQSNDTTHIMKLILTAKVLHWMLGKKADLEIIIVR